MRKICIPKLFSTPGTVSVATSATAPSAAARLMLGVLDAISIVLGPTAVASGQSHAGPADQARNTETSQYFFQFF